MREKIVKLRKQNQSVYDISEALKKDGTPRSAVAVGEVLKREGFAKLPRRRDEERPAGTRPTAADQADVRELSLKPRSFRTKYGGLFLFLPALASLGFDQVIRRSELPGTETIFDSKLTTQAKLSDLNRQGILFITLRRRGPKLKQELAARPRSAWRRIELAGVSRIYKTPRILDEEIALDDYRHLGQTIGHGYETVKYLHLFNDFVDATAQIMIGFPSIPGSGNSPGSG